MSTFDDETYNSLLMVQSEDEETSGTNKSAGNTRRKLCQLHFPTVIGICCLLPLLALTFCEAWSVIFDFEELTATKCPLRIKAWNFLPSISAAIGAKSPQRYVWQICIALHTTPRFLIARGYYNKHRSVFPTSGPLGLYGFISLVVYVLHIVEILSLLGLSVFPSNQDYTLHKWCFCTFLFCSFCHMVLMCLLHSQGKKILKCDWSRKENLSLKFKKILLPVQMGVICFAIYLFSRHVTFCEDGIYSLFALCEIIIVVINILFHATAMLDFSATQIYVKDTGTVR